jgi:hypothetical protein
MCFARAADHLQTSLSAALAPLQLKKPPTPACLSRAKREKEACKHTFSKQTSYPQKKNRYSSRRATTTSKTKQNKTNKKLEFQRERAKRLPTNYNFKPKSTTLGRTQFKCSRPDTREWQRDKENRERQTETKREPRGDERDSERESLER